MSLSRILLGTALLSAASAAQSAPAHLQLGSEGEILAWLVSGPFPNVGALELRGTGFATDYLGDEAQATAIEGREIPMIPFERDTNPQLAIKRRAGWVLGLGDARSGIDLGHLLDGSKPGIAYLYTELIAPADMDAKILFGSDDGAKLWVNGEVRFSKQVARGVKRDEDSVSVRLRTGTNRLLFKIEQGDGGWGLLARVVGLDGKPVPGLVQSLDVLSSGSGQVPGESWIRSAAGKPGILDVQAAIDYDVRSRQVRRWISRFRAEAVEPMRVDEALRTAEARTHSAARGNVDNLSLSLREAAQTVDHEYVRARSKLLRETQNPKPLFATEVAHEDYVGVMGGGRYFVHADGKPFIPLGYNHNPDWPKFDEANPLRDIYVPDLPDRYMAHLRENGVNMIRLMIETPQSGNLEEPIGTFSPEHVRWVDSIVLAARKHGIKLIMTPWDTFWMNLRFDRTPYNPELGGLLKNRLDFITSPAIREQQKRRVKFMIDRWGNSGTIFSWELLNEADLWWGANPAQLRAWVDDMAAYARGYEKRKWGRNHMLSVSFAEAMPKGDLGRLAYGSPHLDYATTHLYIGASRAPKEAVGPALGLKKGVEFSLRQITDNRPFMDTENGPIDRWVESETLDDEVFHGMIWAHLASGGAGSGFRWPYRNPHHLTEGMLRHLKHMSAFVDETPWKALAGGHVPMSVEGEKGTATCGFASRDAALVWTSGGGPIVVRWLGPAQVRCRVFNTRTGKWGSSLVLVGRDGAFQVPGISDSFAVVLTRL